MFPSASRILIVDDLQSLRDLLKAYLRRIGYRQIVEAVDGKDAYQLMIAAKVTGAPFDLVISDWNMPNMDGLEFLAHLMRLRPPLVDSDKAGVLADMLMEQARANHDKLMQV